MIYNYFYFLQSYILDVNILIHILMLLSKIFHIIYNQVVVFNVFNFEENVLWFQVTYNSLCHINMNLIYVHVYLFVLNMCNHILLFIFINYHTKNYLILHLDVLCYYPSTISQFSLFHIICNIFIPNLIHYIDYNHIMNHHITTSLCNYFLHYIHIFLSYF